MCLLCKIFAQVFCPWSSDISVLFCSWIVANTYLFCINSLQSPFPILWFTFIVLIISFAVQKFPNLTALQEVSFAFLVCERGAKLNSWILRLISRRFGHCFLLGVFCFRILNLFLYMVLVTFQFSHHSLLESPFIPQCILGTLYPWKNKSIWLWIYFCPLGRCHCTRELVFLRVLTDKGNQTPRSMTWRTSIHLFQNSIVLLWG